MTLYQPFLDYALEQVTGRLKTEAYPIPEGYETKSVPCLARANIKRKW